MDSLASSDVQPDICRSEEAGLEEEAAVLAPKLARWRQLHTEEALSDVDLVGAFVLAYAAIRRPRAWAGAVIRAQDSVPAYGGRSALMREVPGLLEVLDAEYLRRKLRMENLPELTIYLLFLRVQLAGIKKNSDGFIRTSMLKWFEGHRPYELLFHIPSPIQVLSPLHSFTRETSCSWIRVGAAATGIWAKGYHNAHKI